MSNKLLDSLEKVGLWPRNHLPCALGLHPEGSGEPGSRGQHRPPVVPAAWGPENLEQAQGLCKGTEGSTVHLHGAPSWHSKNVITGTSKTTRAPLGLGVWEDPGGDSDTERCGARKVLGQAGKWGRRRKWSECRMGSTQGLCLSPTPTAGTDSSVFVPLAVPSQGSPSRNPQTQGLLSYGS